MIILVFSFFIISAVLKSMALDVIIMKGMPMYIMSTASVTLSSSNKPSDNPSHEIIVTFLAFSCCAFQ